MYARLSGLPGYLSTEPPQSMISTVYYRVEETMKPHSLWRGQTESNRRCILSVRCMEPPMPVAFSRFLAVLPLHNVHMNARLSGLPSPVAICGVA